jgi:hypothetical protein
VAGNEGNLKPHAQPTTLAPFSTCSPSKNFITTVFGTRNKKGRKSQKEISTTAKKASNITTTIS